MSVAAKMRQYRGFKQRKVCPCSFIRRAQAGRVDCECKPDSEIMKGTKTIGVRNTVRWLRIRIEAEFCNPIYLPNSRELRDTHWSGRTVGRKREVYSEQHATKESVRQRAQDQAEQSAGRCCCCLSFSSGHETISADSKRRYDRWHRRAPRSRIDLESRAPASKGCNG